MICLFVDEERKGCHG